MSYRMYWRRNDGVSGHVWLSAGDMDALRGEMALQGMPWPGDRLPAPGGDAVVEADEVERTVATARETPLTLFRRAALARLARVSRGRGPERRPADPGLEPVSR